MKRYLIIAVITLTLLFSCDIMNNASTDEVNTVQTNLSIEGFTINLSGAKSLITKGSGSRTLTENSPIASLMINSDGESFLESLFLATEDVVFPEVKFITVAEDNSIYLCFDGILEINDIKIHFMHINTDETFDIIESESGVVDFQWYWSNDQDPLAFTSDGSVFYAFSEDNKTKLKKFNGIETSTIGSETGITIERFFSDGVNLFYLGRNTSSDNNSQFMRVIKPGQNSENIFYDAYENVWIKDVFKYDDKLILSGWNIPDANLDRTYNGILELTTDENGDFKWLQVFGSALTDGGTSRLSINSEIIDSQEVLDIIISQFFINNTIPEDLLYSEIINIIVDLNSSDVSFESEELTFWYNLLKDYEGFDTSYFDLLKLNTQSYIYPFLGVGDTGNSITLNEYIFNTLFEDNLTSGSFIPLNDQESFTFDLENYEILKTYFTSINTNNDFKTTDNFIEAKTTAVLNAKDHYETDYTDFKYFLDNNFTYTIAEGVDLETVTYNTVYSYLAVPDIQYIYNFFRDYIYTDSETKNYIKTAYINDDDTINKDKVESLFSKFYLNPTLKLDNTYVEILSNSANNKLNTIDEILVSENLLVEDVSAIDWTKFSTYTKNPYDSNDFTNFLDTFSNLERFTITGDKYYGLFSYGSNSNNYKILQLTDNIGNIIRKTLIEDINATTIDVKDNIMIYLSIDDDDYYSINMIDLTDENLEEEVLVSSEEHLEILSYSFNTSLKVLNFTAYNYDDNLTYTCLVDLNNNSVDYNLYENLSNESDIEILE